MSLIRIQGTDLAYTDADVITFDEGLIGLPHLRRLVLIRQENVEPFLWIASPDDEHVAFLVVDPRVLFADYTPEVPVDVRARLEVEANEAPLVLSTTTINSDWTRSTINLRAPLFISPKAMRGAQVVLIDTSYQLAAPLPTALAA